MKFSDYNISKDLKKRLDELGMKRPTDIQFRAIRHIMDGEDVMAVAQTGTGKTLAFAIPTLNMILKSANKYDKKAIQCLVLVPTRELAEQIGTVYKDLGKYTNVNVLALFGGVEQDSQKEILGKGVDVLVTTPGRMFDLISQKSIDVSSIKCLVLDEADLMLDMGFAKDIKDVLRHVPRKRQTLFFSATISKKIKALAYNVVRNAIRIQISPKNPVAKNVEHSVAFIEMDDKRFFLENIVKEHQESKIVAFVRTKVRAERVVEAMRRVNIEAEALHGGVDQNDRFGILERFKSGETNLLITTDVAARGIDIPGVDYVVNYDLPENPENYVHRCGRTGRGNNKGQAVSFCSANEKTLLSDIEDYTGNEIERFELSKGDYQIILDDTEDGSDDWQSLIKKANREDGTEDVW